MTTYFTAENLINRIKNIGGIQISSSKKSEIWEVNYRKIAIPLDTSRPDFEYYALAADLAISEEESQ